MGIATSNRRQFLQSGLALTGLGLLTGCGVPSLSWQQPAKLPRIGYTWNGPVSPTYVDKILNGARPGDLPIEQPTVFDFGINLKTAEALGLTIPPSMLAQATVIVQ